MSRTLQAAVELVTIWKQAVGNKCPVGLSLGRKPFQMSAAAECAKTVSGIFPNRHRFVTCPGYFSTKRECKIVSRKSWSNDPVDGFKLTIFGNRAEGAGRR
jgi:hypothetical protein